MNSKEPNFVFYASLTANDLVIKRVLCHIFLPVKLTESINILLFLSYKQHKVFRDNKFFQFSISGDVRDNKNRIYDNILADNVFCDDLSFVNFPPNYQICLSCTVRKLTVKSFVRFKQEKKVYIEFWLTRNMLLGQSVNKKRVFELHDIKETIYYREFELDRILFKFEYQKKRYTNQDKDDVTFYELVSKVEVEGETCESVKINEIAQIIDDIALIASFAIRHGTSCLGWKMFDGKTSVKRFLRDRYVPEANEGRNGINPVIGFAEFPEFLKVSFRKLRDYDQIDSLRRAIATLVFSEKATIEGKFMALYSILEMLVLQFRRNSGLEFIIPKNKFEKQVRKKLKTVIDDFDLPDFNSEKKELMKEKLSELNRIAFATALKEFCKFYSINLDDLWSVTSTKCGISLAQIRNKLVHGEHFYNSEVHSIMIANNHLRWTVERMVLGILDWSVEKSDISTEKLEKAMTIYDWKVEQQNLTKKGQ